MYGDYGGRRGGPIEDIRRSLLRGGIPVTLFLLFANVATFFLLLALPRAGLDRYLAFSTAHWPLYFWTFLTWPLVAEASPFSLLFSLGWFYTIGGSLERSWGSRVFGNCVVATAVTTALSVWAGSFVAGMGLLNGLWVLSGAATVAWALCNKREVFSFWGLPLPAPALIVLGCALSWIYGGAGYSNPVIGLFALSGCGAAWWYVTNGRSGNYPGFTAGRGQRRPGSGNGKPNLRFHDFERETRDGSSRRRGFSLARWWRERQEKKRLEAMFRRSGFTDPTDPEERRRK